MAGNNTKVAMALGTSVDEDGCNVDKKKITDDSDNVNKCVKNDIKDAGQCCFCYKIA